MKTVYIMSAKYAPGHFSHMLAYYKIFQAKGYAPCLLLDEQYADFITESSNYNYRLLNKEGLNFPDLLFIYNLSVKDSYIINQLSKSNKSKKKSKVFFVYHEPWYGIKKWYLDLKNGNESLRECVKSLGRYFFVRNLLKKCDKVILPSQKAYKNYEKICRKFNENYTVFPLVFTDESTGKLSLTDKKYFSFISTASNSKNFQKFIEYIKYRSKKDQYSLFQIATRTDISEFIDDELKALIHSKRLIVNHGHDLSNEEINHAYAVSNCTWMLYNRSTQSGALCKSFMFGAPVIASDIGSFREVVNETNGIILNKDASFDEIDVAYRRILECLYAYSEGARKTFLNKFYYKCQIDKFDKVLRVI